MHWKKVLDKFCHKSFKKIRITNKQKEDKSKIEKEKWTKEISWRKNIFWMKMKRISDACQDANIIKVALVGKEVFS